MFESNPNQPVDRRSFLRGSALFAAALGLSVVPALAQQQPEQKKKEDEKKEGENPFGEKEDGKLYDSEGVEYRVCPQCAFNMYKQGRMWVCENCGYSYVE